MAEEFIYCVGKGSYSYAQVIGAFRTAKQRQEWLERQAANLTINLEVKYYDPNAPKPTGSFGTVSTASLFDSLRPPEQSYWYVTGESWISAVYGKFATQAEAEAHRDAAVSGKLVPMTDFLPYWTQDVPIWDVNHVISEDEDDY